jgi:hypothetical protein
MKFFKSTFPVALAFVMGLVGVTVFFSPHPLCEGVRNELSVWGKYIGIVTVFIGLYSLLKLHWGRIRRRQKGWGYSGLFFLFFLLVLGFGLANKGPVRNADEKPVRDAQGNIKTKFYGPLHPRDDKDTVDGVSWLYNAIADPAGSTMFSILGFFICSAAYRTFRAKTLESGILLVAALLVMLGQVPLAGSISRAFPAMSGWLMDVPNMAVKRAILFGVCLGSVGASLRVMFGIERSYLGGDK